VRYCRGQVPFTDVLELVRGLKVFVYRGFAFVPQPEFVVIVLNVFRSKLSHSLVVSLYFHVVITVIIIICYIHVRKEKLRNVNDASSGNGAVCDWKALWNG